MVDVEIAGNGNGLAGVGINPTAGNPGGSGLSYDPQSDQYNYVWKTQNAWSGTCLS